MSALRMTYLALAFLGAVIPAVQFVEWFVENGVSVGGLIEAWQVNSATSGLMWELVIASVALTIWILAEVAVRRDWEALIAIPATFLIGLSCGLPLYLFLRSAPVK